MSVEVLISTMHQAEKDYTLLERMNIQTDAVVINQCRRSSKQIFRYKNFRITWIDTCDRGLSKSRNMAISNSTGKICLIADDDEELADGYKDIIEKAFDTYTEIDLIRFRIQGIEKNFKIYNENPCKIGKLFSLKISSVEIAFRRETIVKQNLKFDELIGAGTNFFMGEENKFVMDYLRNSNKAMYVPETIANLHIGNSSWFRGFDENYYVARGASYAAISPQAYNLLIFLFAIKHKNISNIGLLNRIKKMREGAIQYRLKSRK